MTHKTFSLLQAPAGSVVTVARIDGGRGLRAKLCAMGITPGTCIEMCCACKGPRRIRVRDASLVLDESVGGHIICCENPVHDDIRHHAHTTCLHDTAPEDHDMCRCRSEKPHGFKRKCRNKPFHCG